MNPSEFERTKPVNTHRKIKELEKLIKGQKDLEMRVSGLEYFKYYLAGIVAAVSVGANYLMNKIKGV